MPTTPATQGTAYTGEPYYDYPINNPHSKDDGVDLATPDNTPISLWEPGHVIDASYYVYGGQVVVHPDRGGHDDYAIHLNRIFVQPGDYVEPGEIIGTSGGGIGDLLKHAGRVQPAQSQSWFEGHSSGYHTEVGEFVDSSQSGSMSQFNEGWGGQGGRAGRQIDPTPIIDQLRAEHEPQYYGTGAGQAQTTADTSGSSSQPSADWKDPNTWGPAVMWGIATSMGFDSPGNMAARLAAYAAGIGLVGIALFVVVQPEAGAAINVLGKVAPV